MGKRFNVLSPVIIMRRGGRRKEEGRRNRRKEGGEIGSSNDARRRGARGEFSVRTIGVFQRNLSKDGRASAKTNGCNGYRCSVEASDSRRCVSRQTQRNT